MAVNLENPHEHLSKLIKRFEKLGVAPDVQVISQVLKNMIAEQMEAKIRSHYRGVSLGSLIQSLKAVKK